MPPRGVKKGSKRARQYEHIKSSEKTTPRKSASKVTKARLQRAVAGAG